MTRPSSSDALAPGQRIGPFVLLAPLGAGGSSRVWAAARLGQLGFNKRMVLKVMRADQLPRPSARRRFDLEARLGAHIRHPNLRSVHELGSHEGRPYMALSWVDASLAELLEYAPGQRLAPAVACWIGMQCCAALTAAHGWVERGSPPGTILHRDVSPGNILLSLDGQALLADLAAPEATGSPGGAAGARFFGSVAYSAPEALRQQALDGRTDVYSLGCVLFEALAGAPAFEGDDERAVMFQILERGAPELAPRAPDAPQALTRVVQRCLARQREERFESALALRAALSACQGERTAFSLERETATLIREVLGARIREREEMMHAAFERFAHSALGRTDTLPIAAAGPGAPRTGPATPALARPSDHSGAVVLVRQSAGRRRSHALVAALVLLVLGLVYASSRPPRFISEVTRANRPATQPSARVVPRQGRGAPTSAGRRAHADETTGDVHDAAAPPGAGGDALASTARRAEPEEGTESPSAAPASGAARATPPGAGGAPAATARAPGAPRGAPAPRDKPAAPPRDPFGSLRLEPNPYAKLARKGTAPASPPRPSAEPGSPTPPSSAPSTAAPPQK